MVEQHADDLTRLHAYLYSKYPFAKKSSDKVSQELIQKITKNEIPAIEIKGSGEHGIAFCAPSYHENGQRYKIIGMSEPECIEGFDKHIDSICTKYGIKYLDNDNSTNSKAQPSIEDLVKPDTKIFEGHNRHEALLRIMESLLARNKAILPPGQIIKIASEWNNQHCIPPLDQKEFEKQWKDAMKFVETNGGNNHEGGQNDNISQQRSSRVKEALKLSQENCSELFLDQYGARYAAISVYLLPSDIFTERVQER